MQASSCCFFVYFVGLVTFALISVASGEDGRLGPARETVELRHGDLQILFRDNSRSPRVLSGVDSLTNVRDAPGFDAFDPDDKGGLGRPEL